MECSAKDNYNVIELFKTLLSLSKLIPPEQTVDPHGGPLKRRSSAYVSATSKGELITCQIGNLLNQSNSHRKKPSTEPITRKWEVVFLLLFKQQRKRSVWLRHQVKAKVEVRNLLISQPMSHHRLPFVHICSPLSWTARLYWHVLFLKQNQMSVIFNESPEHRPIPPICILYPFIPSFKLFVRPHLH